MKDNLHTPWSDVCELFVLPDNQDTEGYGVAAPVKKAVYCNWQDGVSQSEFYLSQKAGMRASAQVEIHKVDMLEAYPAGTGGERFVDFGGRHYKVLRDFPQSFDTQTLILTEVIL